MPSIETIVRSWEMSGASDMEAGATREELAEVARALGREWPDEFVDLYMMCNGGGILGGNLELYPLDGSDISLARASRFLLDNGWPIPNELVVFAGDGTGNQFGLWLPAEEQSMTMVVEVGEIFEEGSFAVTGTSISGFLHGRSAYYLHLLECPESALDLLGAPPWFKERPAEELTDEDYESILRWANPGLPEHSVSSYEARLTAAHLRALAT